MIVSSKTIVSDPRHRKKGFLTSDLYTRPPTPSMNRTPRLVQKATEPRKTPLLCLHFSILLATSAWFILSKLVAIIFIPMNPTVIPGLWWTVAE